MSVGVKEFKNSEKGFSLIGNPFTEDLDNSPTELQCDLIDIQNKSHLENASPENDLLNIHNFYGSREDFPKLCLNNAVTTHILKELATVKSSFYQLH